jgi:hypothetical protein
MRFVVLIEVALMSDIGYIVALLHASSVLFAVVDREVPLSLSLSLSLPLSLCLSLSRYP